MGRVVRIAAQASEAVGSVTPGSGHLSIIFVTVFIADRRGESSLGNAMNVAGGLGVAGYFLAFDTAYSAIF